MSRPIDTDHLPVSGRQMHSLRKMIDSGGPALVFQPKFCCRKGYPDGVEVLARWPDAQLPWQHPEHFFRMAEQSGLAPALDLQVLRKTLTLLAGLPADASRNLGRVSVNVSAVSAQDPLFLRAAGELLAASPQRSQIRFELTETAPIRHFPVVRKGFEQLSRHGADLSLDDFLQGYATPELLNLLPVREIKIDRRDVAGLDAPASHRRVCELIELARQRNITVTAEGVETRTQWNTLRRLRCDFAQGFWLSRPLPLTSLLDLLTRLKTGKRVRSAFLPFRRKPW